MVWLLEHGADPSVPSYVNEQSTGKPWYGETPLHRVSAAGRSESIARALITHGARVNAERGDGMTPYRLAYRAGYTAIAQLLQLSGADTSVLTPMDRLVGACMVADARSARAVLAEHAGLAATMTNSDRQLLMQAVEMNRTDSVQLMLDLGWSLTDESEWGGTPLHWAAWHGSEHTARMLVARGAPINVRDSQYGSSPIAWAAHGSTNSRHGSAESYAAIVTLLMTSGATQAESINRWNEPPDAMATEMVAALLRPWLRAG
jgi:ankyrin repeat protein